MTDPDSPRPKYSRVVLKLSGESFAYSGERGLQILVALDLSYYDESCKINGLIPPQGPSS